MSSGTGAGYRTSPRPLAKLAPPAPRWRLAWAWCRGVFGRVELRRWRAAQRERYEFMRAADVAFRARATREALLRTFAAPLVEPPPVPLPDDPASARK